VEIAGVIVAVGVIVLEAYIEWAMHPEVTETMRKRRNSKLGGQPMKIQRYSLK
jgi:hypothetical protein